MVKIQREIKGKIISGKLKDIPEVLKSHVVQALPKKLDSKQLNTFEVEFDKKINAGLDKLMKQLSSTNIPINHEQYSINTGNTFTDNRLLKSESKYIEGRNNRSSNKPASKLDDVSNVTMNMTKVMRGY